MFESSSPLDLSLKYLGSPTNFEHLRALGQLNSTPFPLRYAPPVSHGPRREQGIGETPSTGHRKTGAINPGGARTAGSEESCDEKNLANQLILGMEKQLWFIYIYIYLLPVYSWAFALNISLSAFCMSQANDPKKKHGNTHLKHWVSTSSHLIRIPTTPRSIPAENEVFTMSLNHDNYKQELHKTLAVCLRVDLYSWVWVDLYSRDRHAHFHPTSKPPKRAITSPHAGKNPFQLSPLSHGEAPIIGKIWEKTAENSQRVKLFKCQNCTQLRLISYYTQVSNILKPTLT